MRNKLVEATSQRWCADNTINSCVRPGAARSRSLAACGSNCDVALYFLCQLGGPRAARVTPVRCQDESHASRPHWHMTLS
ncbi:unnamed protein product [Danaus chrysippus]|uniref:(African queen) hypothetical protein n=1 Tax=Danaus chrysippus TaxID=151541 RepID=A0A8J2QKX6_9NEOP|nr:unnamed protein product [Danaus chrysippus]